MGRALMVPDPLQSATQSNSKPTAANSLAAPHSGKIPTHCGADNESGCAGARPNLKSAAQRHDSPQPALPFALRHADGGIARKRSSGGWLNATCEVSYLRAGRSRLHGRIPIRMRRLQIRPRDVQTYQQLAAFIIFAAQLRPRRRGSVVPPKVNARSGGRAFPATCRLS